MKTLARLLEATGIVCVMIGLLHGIMTGTLWVELYAGIIGVVVFLAGRGLERLHGRKKDAPPLPHGDLKT